MIIMAIIVLTLLCIIIAYRKALSREKEKLRISEELYKIISESLTVTVWHYDFKTNNVVLSDGIVPNRYIKNKVISNVPESIIESNIIHPDSIENFREMFRKLISGEKHIECVIKICLEDYDKYRYEHIRYSTIYDNSGKSYIAIGVAHDVTEKIILTQHYQLEGKMMKSLTPNIYANIIINVTQRTVEDINTDVENEKQSFVNVSFNDIFSEIAKTVVNNEKVRRNIVALDAKALLDSYIKGKKIIVFEYMRKNFDENAIWISLEIHLLKEPVMGDIKAFIYFKNIDKQKREYAELEHKAQHDSLTGLYNISTFKELVNNYITGEGGMTLNAFIMLDLDNFKKVNDTLSHCEGDRVLIRVADELMKLFSKIGYIARIGGDEFCVFLKNAESVDFIEKNTTALCEAMQFSTRIDDIVVEVSCSAGISLCDNGNKTYDVLYQEADLALYKAKDMGKKCYSLSNDIT